MIIFITGFSHSKGIAKNTQKPYNMARLYRLSEIRTWQNDLGIGRAAGFLADDKSGFDVNILDERLLNDLLLIKYPCELDLNFEPHPEDPTRNVVSGFKTVKQDKNPLG